MKTRLYFLIAFFLSLPITAKVGNVCKRFVAVTVDQVPSCAKSHDFKPLKYIF